MQPKLRHVPPRCPPSGAIFPLASRTEVRRSPAYLFPNHLSSTLRTRPPMLLEDPQVVLMLAWPVQDILVKPHCGPPMLHAGREVGPYRRMQRLPFALRKSVCLAPRMQPRIVQDFIGVDVSYAGDDFLIQEQGLYLGSSRTDGTLQISRVELFLQGLWSERGEPLLEFVSVEQARSCEARLVAQEEPPVAVEIQDEHERRLRLLDRRHEQELAPDLQLKYQRVSGAKLHDEVLGPPPRPCDTDALEPACELFGRRLLRERSVENSGPLYLRAGDQLAQVFFYGLDLWQLRHTRIYTRSALPYSCCLMTVCARRMQRGPPPAGDHRKIASSEPGSPPVRVLRIGPTGRRVARDGPPHPACSTPQPCGNSRSGAPSSPARRPPPARRAQPSPHPCGNPSPWSQAAPAQDRARRRRRRPRGRARRKRAGKGDPAPGPRSPRR